MLWFPIIQVLKTLNQLLQSSFLELLLVTQTHSWMERWKGGWKDERKGGRKGGREGKGAEGWERGRKAIAWLQNCSSEWRKRELLERVTIT